MSIACHIEFGPAPRHRDAGFGRMLRCFASITFLVLIGAAWAGCAKSGTQVCGDGLRCPVGTQCVLNGAPADNNWECAVMALPDSGLAPEPVPDASPGPDSGAGCSTELIEPTLECNGAVAMNCLDSGFDIGRTTCESNGVSTNACGHLDWQPSSVDVAGQLLRGIQAVWMDDTGTRLVVVTDRGEIAHRDDQVWSLAGAFGRPLHDVWGRSESEMYAVGDGIIVEFDGELWQEVPEIDATLSFRSVSGSDQSADTYAIAENGEILYHDGIEWERLDLIIGPFVNPELGGGFLRGSELLVVGTAGLIGGRVGLHASCSGGECTAVSEIPVPRSCNQPGSALRSIWSSSDGNFAVGYCKGEGISQVWLAHSSDGVIWESESIPLDGMRASSELFDVWGTSADNIFAVGDFGLILHYDGERWVEMTIDAANPISMKGVIGTDNNEVYAVGADTMLQYGGKSLDPLGPPPRVSDGIDPDTLELEDIWAGALELFVAGRSASAGGSAGLLLHRNGFRWAPAVIDRPMDNTNVFAVHGIGFDRILAVGRADSAGTSGFTLDCLYGYYDPG